MTLALATQPPVPIDLLRENPVAKCGSCSHTQQYLISECFLARLGAKTVPDRATSTLVIGACLIAAVKLSRVERAEIQNRRPRVRAALADALAIAKMVTDHAASK